MKNNKGYAMTEAFIVSAIVLTALVLIYAQFARVNRGYTDAYYYNNVNGIYALNQISTYLNDEDISVLASALTSYVDITNCSETYFTKTSYCNILISSANIKHLLFTYNNKDFLISSLSMYNPYDLRMQKFIKTVDDSDSTYNYMLVAEFNDGSYAAIPYNYEYNEPVTYAVYPTGTPIYYDVDAGRICSETESEANYASNTVMGLSEGCMRFYTLIDNKYKSTIDLILDHNVTVATAWGNAASEMNSITAEWEGLETPDNYTQNILDTNGNPTTNSINYKDLGYNSRLITADEIARIVGKEGWSSETASKNTDKFYLDGAYGTTWQTQVARYKGASHYGWLYSYLSGCENFGCDINGDGTNSLGYWTFSKETKSVNYWLILNNGMLDSNGSGQGARGTRPVIRLSKAKMPEIKSVYEVGQIVYFDVRKGKACTEEEAAANVNANGIPTGIKDNCMKFYVVKESPATSNKVEMILDHNTRVTVIWNSTQINENGPVEILTALHEDTDSWVGTITPENFTYTFTKSSTEYSYTIPYKTGDDNGPFKARLYRNNELAFASNTWLVDNLKGHGDDNSYNYSDGMCAISGTCSLNGYWTSDANSTKAAWRVDRNGMNGTTTTENGWSGGLRPVIIVDKDNLTQENGD